MTPRLELRTSQTLVMTPQLQQAIKLLQMSNLELNVFVEQELERNPLLERGEPDAPTIDQPPEEPAPALPDETDLRLALDQAPPDAASDLDTDFDNVYPDSVPQDLGAANLWGGKGGDPGFEDAEALIESLADSPKTLREHLLDQLGLATADPQIRMIGAQLVEMIDEAGYLAPEWCDLPARLGMTQGRIEEVLHLIQSFDPTGCGARNLKECLSLQLKEKDRLDSVMRCFLDHLDLLAKRDLANLMRVCGCDAEDLSDMIAEVKRLNPKPGLKFASEEAETLIPDVFVRRAPDGTWMVELNSETLPRLLVDQRYAMKIGHADKKTKAYLSDCLASANWLVRSLDQRARTILKVSAEIIRFQDRFFTHGVEYLRPLTLRAVAEAIEMHESTVSRVTANKYLSSPRGVFELKYFFTAGIANAAGGEAHSAEAVRHKLKSLIDAESADSILSDDRLVEILRSEGIDIARRTVAKYRESLKIPSSIERRRLKLLKVPA